MWSRTQQTDIRPLPDVDRVIVVIERMSVKNRHQKQFGVDLGHQLEWSVVDNSKCVIRLSQLHLLEASGVIDHLGMQ